MKRLLLSALIAFTCHAASWDGQHGDMTVVTVSVNRGTLPFSIVQWPGLYKVTQIYLNSTDKTVAGYRVTAHLRDKSSLTVTANGPTRDGELSAVVFWGAEAEDIASVTITKLREGESTEIPATEVPSRR